MSETRTSPPTATAPARSGSPIRLLALLGLLAVVVGMYCYDYFVAEPESVQAHADIEALVIARNARGVGDNSDGENSDLVRSKDMQKLLGAPTFTKEGEDYTIEYYCWWGQIPGLNTWKRYVTVLYEGEVPRRYESHYLNEAPPAQDMPGYVPPPSPEGTVGAEEMFGPDGPLGGGAAETTAEPAEGTPAESAEDKPAEETSPKPAEDKPAEDKPAEDKPAEDKPAEDKPAEDKPAEETAPKPAAASDAPAAKSDE
ncbi:MAG: hypothetical protein WD872_12380 [Pirellulaceae bacterium]